MPRVYQGPFLYLDPQRQRWCIRDRKLKTRLPFTEAERTQAELALHDYKKGLETAPTAFVYFITADHGDFPIKIGVTTRRFNRIGGLQNGCPYRLRIVGIIEATGLLERQLHRRLAEYRLEGEWFAREEEVVSVLRGACRQHGVAFDLYRDDYRDANRSNEGSQNASEC